MEAREFLRDASARSAEHFKAARRVLGYGEFLTEFQKAPARLARTAPQYIADMLDHFGEEKVQGACGVEISRPRVFNAPFDDGGGRLWGQDEAVAELARHVRDFAAAGRADRIVLLHGPNGSSKTTIVDLIFRGLEAYSHTDEGALYRYSWLFSERTGEGGHIGFGQGDAKDEEVESLAHLDGSLITCRVPCPMKDNPISLLPPEERRTLLSPAGSGTAPPGPTACEDAPCPTCAHIFDALMAAYKGDLARVLRHVQVERFYVSRRYRTAAVSIEPQGNIDAGTAPISREGMTNLPAVLQGLNLVIPFGDLVDGNRSLVEYSDFLKRPIEANKYLLTTSERGTLALPNYAARLDAVLVATANETHLTAFKVHPDFTAFKGRIELVRVPYILERSKEERIYTEPVRRLGRSRHVSPHTAEITALWAVLTRLRRPKGDHFEGDLARLAPDLTPLEKARLYDAAAMPDRFSAKAKRNLRAGLPRLREEYQDALAEFEGAVCAAYEGRRGASPREARALLEEAAARSAARSAARCLTPLVVLECVEELARDPSVYDFLRLPPDGDYWNAGRLIEIARESFLEIAEREVNDCLGLAEPGEYDRLVEEYFQHVRAYVSKTKVRNRTSGALEPASEPVMRGVEEHLGVEAEGADTFRRDLLTRLAAYAIDHPGLLDTHAALPDIFERLRGHFFAERRVVVERFRKDMLKHGTEEFKALGAREQKRVSGSLSRMAEEYGYCETCAKEIISFVLHHAR